MPFTSTGFHPDPVEVVELPDVELMLITYLRAVLDESVHVCSVAPPDGEMRSLAPVVRVVHQDGTATDSAWAGPDSTDEALVDVDIWHSDLADLKALTTQVRSLIGVLGGAVIGDGVVVGVTQFAGPRPIDEPDPLLLRAGLSVVITVKPHSS